MLKNLFYIVCIVALVIWFSQHPFHYDDNFFVKFFHSGLNTLASFFAALARVLAVAADALC